MMLAPVPVKANRTSASGESKMSLMRSAARWVIGSPP